MKFNLQPHLVGTLVEVRPLRSDDWNELFKVASDPLIWEQHPANDRFKEDVFRAFFKEAMESGGGFAIIDRDSGQTIGSSRFHGFEPNNSEIEIGWTFLARPYWGGRYNGEVKRLLLAHAFQYVDRVVFYVGEHNIRSQKAIEKIGGIRSSVVMRSNQGRTVRNFKYIINNPTGRAALSQSSSSSL